MSGYREPSYDPDHYQVSGAPLKPYNWVQWAGTLLALAGAAIILVEWGGKLGWIPRWIEDAGFAPLGLLLLGMILVNSRRGPNRDVSPRERDRNRQIAILITIVGAALIVVAMTSKF